MPTKPWWRRCVACGTNYQTTSQLSRYCDDNCRRRSKSRKPRSTARRFVGVDGEGFNVGSYHRYTLLSVGDRSLYLPDDENLTWEHIFPFLWECFTADPDATYVGYFLNYDFCMWLRTLPEERARMLLTAPGIAKRQRKTKGNPKPFPVDVRGLWEIDTLNLRRFQLRPGPKHPEYRPRGPWMTICDVGSFFQQSFLKTIVEYEKTGLLSLTAHEMRVIETGKAGRREFTSVTPELIEYNVTENRILAKILAVFDESVQQGLGVTLPRDAWFGPGQIAQGWLMKTLGSEWKPDVESHLPASFLDLAQKTYYGGWFEVMGHGLIPGAVEEADINSAYPAVIAELPCLLHGKVVTHERVSSTDPDRQQPYMIVDATIVAAEGQRTGPVPFRYEPDRIGRPVGTFRGWYWRHELEAAMKAGLLQSYSGSAQEYVPCDCPPPLDGIRDLYLRRIRDGGKYKNTSEGKALKLGYNSVYGKLAQSVGNPRFGNPIYASLITAGCRTAILTAIAAHPRKANAVVMVATDGVYFSSPSGMKCSPTELGAFDTSQIEGLSICMPGVYYVSSHDKVRSRGIAAGAYRKAIAEIDQRWTDFRAVVESGGGQEWLIYQDEFPGIHMPIPFQFISLATALHRGDWESAGTVITPELCETYPELGSSIRSLRISPGAHKRANHGWYVGDDGILYSSPTTVEQYRQALGPKTRLMTKFYERAFVDGVYQTLPYDSTFGRLESNDDIADAAYRDFTAELRSTVPGR